MASLDHLQTKGYYRANRVGALLFVMTLCQYGVSAGAFWLLRTLFDVDTSARMFGLPAGGYLAVYALIYTVMMGLPLLFGIRFLHRDLKALSPMNLSIDRQVCVVLCGTAFCMLANLLSSALNEAAYRRGLPRPDARDIGDGSVLIFLLELAVFAVLPALLEESLLRGVVLQSLRPLGNGVAVTVSAVLFGLMHGDLDQVLYTTLMGLVLGFVFVYSDNLGLTVLVHALANALSLTAGFLSQFSSSLTASVWQFILLVFVLVLGVLSAVWMRRHPLSRRRPTYAQSLLVRLTTLCAAPFLWAAVALMIALMVIGNSGG